MAQPNFDRREQESTATMFRLDADALRLATSTPVAPSISAQEAQNDALYEQLGYERPVQGKPLRRKETADQRALAEKSGHVVTDERTMNGVQNIANGTTNGYTASAKAQSEMLRQVATQSMFDRISQSASSMWDSYVADPVSRAWDATTNAFSEYVTQPLSRAWDATANAFNQYVAQPVARAWDATKAAFNEYVAEPAARMATKAGEVATKALEGAKNIVNEYVVAPAAKLATKAGEVATEVGATTAKAWNSAKSTFSEYVADPASKLASKASEATAGAWKSAKNFLGVGESAKPEQEKTLAKTKVETPAERPSAQTQTLSGEQNNPKAGISLGSAFSNAVDNVSKAVGLTNDPSLRAATPAYTPAPGGVM